MYYASQSLCFVSKVFILEDRSTRGLHTLGKSDRAPVGRIPLHVNGWSKYYEARILDDKYAML